MAALALDETGRSGSNSSRSRSASPAVRPGFVPHTPPPPLPALNARTGSSASSASSAAAAAAAASSFASQRPASPFSMPFPPTTTNGPVPQQQPVLSSSASIASSTSGSVHVHNLLHGTGGTGSVLLDDSPVVASPAAAHHNPNRDGSILDPAAFARSYSGLMSRSGSIAG
ncbi:hypothetical protein HK405_006299, partial [Cladochytrium tenue]